MSFCLLQSHKFIVDTKDDVERNKLWMWRMPSTCCQVRLFQRISNPKTNLGNKFSSLVWDQSFGGSPTTHKCSDPTCYSTGFLGFQWEEFNKLCEIVSEGQNILVTIHCGRQGSWNKIKPCKKTLFFTTHNLTVKKGCIQDAHHLWYVCFELHINSAATGKFK